MFHYTINNKLKIANFANVKQNKTVLQQKTLFTTKKRLLFLFPSFSFCFKTVECTKFLNFFFVLVLKFAYVKFESEITRALFLFAFNKLSSVDWFIFMWAYLDLIEYRNKQNSDFFFFGIFFWLRCISVSDLCFCLCPEFVVCDWRDECCFHIDCADRRFQWDWDDESLDFRKW